MKILKIENNVGYFINENSKYKEIHEITKEDIYFLIKLSIEKVVTFDDYEEEKINRPDHKIIYNKISEKIKIIIRDRETLVSNKEMLFKSALEKYKID